MGGVKFGTPMFQYQLQFAFLGAILTNNTQGLGVVFVPVEVNAVRAIAPGHWGVFDVGWPEVWTINSIGYFIWSNYSDLTRPHPKWWLSKENPLISGKSRLVKYYDLARYHLPFLPWVPPTVGLPFKYSHLRSLDYGCKSLGILLVFGENPTRNDEFSS